MNNYQDIWLNDFNTWAEGLKKELKRRGIKDKRMKEIIEKSRLKRNYVANQIEMKEMIEQENT